MTITCSRCRASTSPRARRSTSTKAERQADTGDRRQSGVERPAMLGVYEGAEGHNRAEDTPAQRDDH